MMSDTIWHLYILRLTNGSLYTGITTDVKRRVSEHSRGKGAKYLRGKGELQLVYEQKIGDRSTALKMEHLVKKLPKQRKEMLVGGELRLSELTPTEE